MLLFKNKLENKKKKHFHHPDQSNQQALFTEQFQNLNQKSLLLSGTGKEKTGRNGIPPPLTDCI